MRNIGKFIVFIIVVCSIVVLIFGWASLGWSYLVCCTIWIVGVALYNPDKPAPPSPPNTTGFVDKNKIKTNGKYGD